MYDNKIKMTLEDNIFLANEDREYIRGINISYPGTWKVQIICN